MAVKVLDRIKLDFVFEDDATEVEKITARIHALSLAILDAHEERANAERERDARI